MEGSMKKMMSSLHVFFLPYQAPGHMIPMVDLARSVASRGIKVSIVTTTASAPLIQPTIINGSTSEKYSIQLLTLDVLSSNLMDNKPTLAFDTEFSNFIASLQDPFQDLLNQHRPDLIISDFLYPWTADLGLPRLVFHGSSAFHTVITGIVGKLKLHESLLDDTEPFLVHGMPHQIELTKSQVMEDFIKPNEFLQRVGESFGRSYGMVSNTFYELEPEYVSMVRSSIPKSWNVGPVSIICNNEVGEKMVRGGISGEKNAEYCVSWLDKKKPGSVLYVCFGSLGEFTYEQMHEIAVGLEAVDCPSIWVVQNYDDNIAEWMPAGEDKCLIVKGWVPQILILNHQGIGGFLTHCGWNSCLEGVSAGIPMVTWPLFADQFFNEKLLVNVLGIGVSVGAKVSNPCKEKRPLMKSEEMIKAVNELMGSGEEAEERRNKVKGLAEKAKKAVEQDGSSYNDLSGMIQEFIQC